MADLEDADHKPWEKLSSESNAAYHAFVHYLSLLPHERSMDRAYTNHQKICKNSTNPKPLLGCDPGWTDWRFRFSWPERVAGHDAMLAERDRLQRIHDIDVMNRRHTQLALALQNLLVERLQSVATSGEIFKMTPVQMASLLDKAALVERRSRGEATSIIKHQGPGETNAALDLSKLSDAELEVFQSLVQKAQPAAALPETTSTALVPTTHGPNGHSNGNG